MDIGIWISVFLQKMNAVVHGLRLELSGAMEKRKGELGGKKKTLIHYQITTNNGSMTTAHGKGGTGNNH